MYIFTASMSLFIFGESFFASFFFFLWQFEMHATLWLHNPFNKIYLSNISFRLLFSVFSVGFPDFFSRFHIMSILTSLFKEKKIREVWMFAFTL